MIQWHYSTIHLSCRHQDESTCHHIKCVSVSCRPNTLGTAAQKSPLLMPTVGEFRKVTRLSRMACAGGEGQRAQLLASRAKQSSSLSLPVWLPCLWPLPAACTDNIPTFRNTSGLCPSTLWLHPSCTRFVPPKPSSPTAQRLQLVTRFPFLNFRLNH